MIHFLSVVFNSLNPVYVFILCITNLSYLTWVFFGVSIFSPYYSHSFFILLWFGRLNTDVLTPWLWSHHYHLGLLRCNGIFLLLANQTFLLILLLLYREVRQYDKCHWEGAFWVRWTQIHLSLNWDCSDFCLPTTCSRSGVLGFWGLIRSQCCFCESPLGDFFWEFGSALLV